MTTRAKIVSSQMLSDGWGKLTSYKIDYQRSDGTTDRLSREAYDHGHAAAVLLHDPARDMVVLVRQFRFGAFIAGEAPFLLEVVAGLLDDDDPQTCARREVMEETGIELAACTPVVDFFMTPASVTEKMHCFIGIYHGPVAHQTGLGAPGEGEDIEVIEMPFDTAFAMIGRGEIVDSKTIILLQHMALSRR